MSKILLHVQIQKDLSEGSNSNPTMFFFRFNLNGKKTLSDLSWIQNTTKVGHHGSPATRHFKIVKISTFLKSSKRIYFVKCIALLIKKDLSQEFRSFSDNLNF